MILELHRQGVPVSAIARRTGLDRKTVRKYIQAGLEAPSYGPRQARPTLLDAHHGYLRERVAGYPELSGSRLRSAISARTSSSRAASATSTTSMPSSGNGWTASPMSAPMPPRSGLWPNTLPRSGRA